MVGVRSRAWMVTDGPRWVLDGLLDEAKPKA